MRGCLAAPELLVMIILPALVKLDQLFYVSKSIVWFQLILSRIILESGQCSLPLDNPLWSIVRLPPIQSKDNATCFKGYEYGNCDRHQPRLSYGCKWWHFHSFERLPELEEKYNEVLFYTLKIANKANTNIGFCFTHRLSITNPHQLILSLKLVMWRWKSWRCLGSGLEDDALKFLKSIYCAIQSILIKLSFINSVPKSYPKWKSMLPQINAYLIPDFISIMGSFTIQRILRVEV